MIPPFNSDGKLPPGIHTCTWEEFVAQFGTTSHRLNLIAGLKTAMEQLKHAGCQTVYVDGSFVTNKAVPGDFDACWEVNGVDMNKLKTAAPALLNFANKRAAQKLSIEVSFFLPDGPQTALVRFS